MHIFPKEHDTVVFATHHANKTIRLIIPATNPRNANKKIGHLTPNQTQQRKRRQMTSYYHNNRDRHNVLHKIKKLQTEGYLIDIEPLVLHVDPEPMDCTDQDKLAASLWTTSA